jgi:hypothetical protein
MVRGEWPRAGIATAPPAWEQGTGATAWPLTSNSAARRVNPRAARLAMDTKKARREIPPRLAG